MRSIKCAGTMLLVSLALAGRLAWPKENTMTVSVGPGQADVVGTDEVALQKAVDRVAAAGGGMVLVKAGTYTLNNSLRLASHITLRGEGADKTILKKAPGVISKLALDADYGEFKATIEGTRGFLPAHGGHHPGQRLAFRLDAQRAHHRTH